MNKYNTISSRFVASIIDSLIMIPVGVLAGINLLMNLSPKLAIVWHVIISLIPTVYTIWLHNAFGQTLGKRAMKIKVLDTSEKPISFTQAVIRSLPQMFPVFVSASLLISRMFSIDNKFSNDTFGNFITSFYGLYFVFVIGEIISALFTDKHRALHDFIAGTIVVKTDVDQLSINT